MIFRAILRSNFAGTVYPVNNQAASVHGVRAYASVADLPERADLVVVAVPAGKVLEVAAEALRAGTKGLLVVTSGFAETGPEGAARQKELVDLVRSHGARLIGPNCLGLHEHAPRGQPQREPGARDGAARADRVLLALRRARARHPQLRRRARPGLLHVRLGRESRRRVGQRPAPVLGRGLVDRHRAALPRDVRQPAPLRPRRAPALVPEADPVREERPQPGRPRRGAARTSGRSGRATPTSTCCSTRPASSAPTRWRRCSTSPCCWPTSRCRAATASPSSATPAAS